MIGNVIESQLNLIFRKGNTMNMIVINTLLLVIVFLSIVAYTMAGAKFESKASRYFNYGLLVLGLGLALSIFSFNLEWYILDKIHKAQLRTTELVEARMKSDLEWREAFMIRERNLAIAALKADLEKAYVKQ